MSVEALTSSLFNANGVNCMPTNILRTGYALDFNNMKYATVAEIWNVALTLAADAVIPTHIIDIYEACGICSAKLIMDATGA